jgi:hypothetical protein
MELLDPAHYQLKREFGPMGPERYRSEKARLIESVLGQT